MDVEESQVWSLVSTPREVIMLVAVYSLALKSDYLSCEVGQAGGTKPGHNAGKGAPCISRLERSHRSNTSFGLRDTDCDLVNCPR